MGGGREGAAVQIERIVAFAAVAALMCVMVKQTRPDMALALMLFSGAAMLLTYASGLWQVAAAMEKLGAKAGLSEGFTGTLCKVLGVSLLGEFGAQVCRDAEQCALAQRVELGTRLILTLMALPMLSAIADSALGLVT